MGATNVMAAYQLYAGRLPATSMQLLVYMALVSRDNDERPWYGQGHEALAIHALGRDAPAGRSDIAAVERAIKPLLSIGAIEADRRASVRRDGPRTVRYRLRLVASLPQDIDVPLVDNPPPGPADIDVPLVDENPRPTESVTHVPRNPCSRPTKTVTTSHENRGTEEPRGTRRSEEEEDHLNHSRLSPPSTGAPVETQQINDSQPDPCPGCGVVLDPGRVCGNRHCRHYGSRLATVHMLTAA